MKRPLGMTGLMLVAIGLGAMPGPVAQAADSPESSPAAQAAALIEGDDVKAMTEDQLKDRMKKIADLVTGNNSSELRNALGEITYSNLAISDDQAKAIADRLRTYATKYKNHAELLEREIFRVENLTIGRTAPNITGKDTDGVEFSLADYRGKVVVIDFWGDW